MNKEELLNELRVYMENDDLDNAYKVISEYDTEKSIDLSKLAAESVIDAAKSIASSDLVKDSAAAAAVGAVIAVPVPLVGPATGAVVGAIVGAYSHLTKKK